MAKLEKEHSDLHSVHSDYKSMYKQNEKELTEKCERIEQFEIEVAELEKLLLAKNEEISTQLTTIQEKDKSIQEAEQKLVQSQEEIVGLKLQHQSYQEKIESLSVDTRVSTLEKELESVRQGNGQC